MTVVEWIVQNKQWVFSGVGVSVVTVAWWFRSGNQPGGGQSQRGGPRSQNIQAGRDVHIALSTASSAVQVPALTSADEDLLASMPQLMAEMRAAFQQPGTEYVREFFVLPNRNVVVSSSKTRFVFYEDDYEHLMGQLDVLEGNGLVVDETIVGKTATIYRMSERLVRHLRTGTS